MERSEQERIRIEKLKRIFEMGIEPYPRRFDRTHSISQIKESFESKTREELEQEIILAKTSGRIMTIRRMGGASFFHISDGMNKLQCYIKKDMISEKEWVLFDLLDLGDIIGISGRLFRTKTGELTVLLESLTFLCKSLRPLPEKWHGLQDVEIRFRERHLDLMVNIESRIIFEIRSKLIREIRKFFDERGYVEVETPMMHAIPGGALARPFKTYHNALDMELYLRIAPELYLKRLLVGGYEKIYEINRNFRNEGISSEHNPEFTMIEFYETYKDFRDFMDLTEELLERLAEKIPGKTEIEFNQNIISLKRPFKRIRYKEAIKFYTGLEYDVINNPNELIKKAKEMCTKEKAEKITNYGKALDAIFDEFSKPNLIQPTFVIDFPKEISPLSKSHPQNPEEVERFELIIGGMEIANAFSELNDPFDQRERFLRQAELAGKGDEEAHRIDEDFIKALEYGMPPAAGEGIGVDRLTMLFTNKRSIKEVILFPLLKPKS
ncbi:MAG: lysine--tRNA ligase [Candidatus Aminicenantia bacterium]